MLYYSPVPWICCCARCSSSIPDEDLFRFFNFAPAVTSAVARSMYMPRRAVPIARACKPMPKNCDDFEPYIADITNILFGDSDDSLSDVTCSDDVTDEQFHHPCFNYSGDGGKPKLLAEWVASDTESGLFSNLFDSDSSLDDISQIGNGGTHDSISKIMAVGGRSLWDHHAHHDHARHQDRRVSALCKLMSVMQ